MTQDAPATPIPNWERCPMTGDHDAHWGMRLTIGDEVTQRERIFCAGTDWIDTPPNP